MPTNSFLPNIRRAVPYVPGEQPQGNVIKLNTNENPYPPSPKVRETLASLNCDALRKYPDPDAKILVDAIAAYYKLSPEQIFVGTGSDDCLSMCFLTFFHGQKPILFPDITYSFYKVWAKIYEIPFVTIPLTDDFRINAEDYCRPNGGIVLANPNAPTGMATTLDAIEKIVAANAGSIVIIDEAYVDFGGETALPLLSKYENLVIVRTMSKSRSLAGMRIGYVFAQPQIIRCLNDVKFSVNSYTMNLPSLLVGKAAVEDDAYFRGTVAKIIGTRERAAEKLQKIGFTVLPSATNFLFVTHKTKKAADLFAALKNKNIYTRYFDAPRIDNYLRITIGTDAETDSLCAALTELVQK